MNVEDTQEETRMLSGRVTSDGRLVELLYILMRDHLPVGVVAGIVSETEQTGRPVTYTNGWLAKYAKHLVDRIDHGR